MLSATYPGNNEAFINKELITVRGELIEAFQKSHHESREEATKRVDRDYIGMRRRKGREALYATEEGVKSWLERRAKAHPTAGEQSSDALNKMLHEKGVRINRNTVYEELKKLREELIDAAERHFDIDSQSATEVVNTHYFPMREYFHGKPKIFATPRGVKLWLDERKRNEVPNAGKGEQSAYSLSLEYLGSDQSINRELAALQQELTAEAKAFYGMRDEAASAFVSKHCVGKRKPTTGPDNLHVTPLGKSMWAEAYHRKPRETPKGPKL